MQYLNSFLIKNNNFPPKICYERKKIYICLLIISVLIVHFKLKY